MFSSKAFIFSEKHFVKPESVKLIEPSYQ